MKPTQNNTAGTEKPLLENFKDSSDYMVALNQWEKQSEGYTPGEAALITILNVLVTGDCKIVSASQAHTDLTRLHIEYDQLKADNERLREHLEAMIAGVEMAKVEVSAAWGKYNLSDLSAAKTAVKKAKQ